jgi:hypothetical protein
MLKLTKAWIIVSLLLIGCALTAAVLEQVNTTSPQTLTNKTLTAPTISNPTFSGVGTGQLINLTLLSPAMTTPIFSTIISNGNSLILPQDSDTLVGRATTDTLTNKTLTAPVFGGSITGTYTLGGTPTLTTPTISNPIFSGTAIGTYTFGGTPTVSSAMNLTGGQLVFPATQAGSSGANTLDDYEEGIWTPAVGGTTTYTTQTGQYTKIGRQVTITCTLIINAIGSGSTTIISGLPFTNSGTMATGTAYFASSVTNITTLVATLGGGNNQVVLYSLTAAGASLATNAILQNGTTVNFTLTYFASTT